MATRQQSACLLQVLRRDLDVSRRTRAAQLHAAKTAVRNQVRACGERSSQRSRRHSSHGAQPSRGKNRCEVDSVKTRFPKEVNSTRVCDDSCVGCCGGNADFQIALSVHAHGDMPTAADAAAGYTDLMVDCRDGNADAVAAHLAAGAVIEAKNAKGSTSLVVASLPAHSLCFLCLPARLQWMQRTPVGSPR